LITLEHVSRSFAGREAVRDLSLEVREGELLALIGPSGCGKTTTLRMINRLVEPTGGRILVGGRDAREMSPAALRRTMGYAIQGVGLFPHLTVGQNVAVVPKLLGWPTPRVRARVDELLERVGLDPTRYRDAWPRQLSGGQAQRVGVARALAADPPILLMDEPFGAVDPITRERLQEEFLRIQREVAKTVVFVTHDMDEAVKLSDRIAIMREGRLVQCDTPEAVLERPADAFVRDFVGSDRGLKRLAREPLGTAVRRVVPVRIDDKAGPARQIVERSAARSTFVVDASGVLLGWIDARALAGVPDETSVTGLASRHDWREVALSAEASRRDALSRLVSQDFRTIAVVDSGGRLVGEVSLESLAAPTEARPA
jgi:osmoprotectant transport system ATP-binding protein